MAIGNIVRNKTTNLLLILILLLNNCSFVYAEGNNLNKNKSKQVIKQKAIKDTNDKQFNMVEKKQPVVPDVSFGSEEPQKEELIQVFVKNDFDEEIKVKFDTNREYPIGPHESITLGQRAPGKYTLTIYNKKGEFIDNLTRNIDNKNKFLLNKETVSNSDKITGLTTGQKVAIGAGALGAAAIGTALINKALEGNEQGQSQEQYIPPPLPQEQVVQNQLPIPQGVQPTQPANLPEQQAPQNNAVVLGGMAIKFLDTKYPQLTVIVEGIDGNPIGDNWIIPLAQPEQKPQPLVLNGEKITINSNQKIKVVLPEGLQLQRYGFELEVDPVDNSYIWILK